MLTKARDVPVGSAPAGSGPRQDLGPRDQRASRRERTRGRPGAGFHHHGDRHRHRAKAVLDRDALRVTHRGRTETRRSERLKRPGPAVVDGVRRFEDKGGSNHWTISTSAAKSSCSAQASRPTREPNKRHASCTPALP